MSSVSSRVGWLPRPFGIEYAYFRKWGWLLRRVIRTVGLLDMASRLRWRILAEQLGRRRFERVLDAGCGTGVFAFHLIRTGRADRVDGFDVRREVIDEAARIAREKQLERVRFSHDNLSDWTLPWGVPPYDLIVCIEALTYCRDPLDSLAKFRAALSPQGLLFLTLPHDERLENPRHFSLEDAVHMLHAAGFEVLTATYVIGRYHRALTTVFDLLARFLPPLAVVLLPLLILMSAVRRFPARRGQFVMTVSRPASSTVSDVRFSAANGGRQPPGSAENHREPGG